MMRSRLLAEALVKLTAGIVLLALLLFLPAGTLRYPGAWLLMAMLFIPMFLAGLVMLAKNPSLLAKRLDAKEKQRQQKQIVGLSGLMFIAGFVLAGLDFRFGWSRLPGWTGTAASVLFLLSYALYGEVLRENAYLSRTIGVQENQKVVDTGLYGIVRHPMYAATVFLFLSMPLVLGSLWAIIPLLFYPLLIARRIRYEEQLLTAELPGYTAYMKKVRWRMIPFIW